MKNFLIVLAIVIVLGAIWWFAPQGQEIEPVSPNGSSTGDMNGTDDESLPEAVLVARKSIAEAREIGERNIIVTSAQEKSWPDSCLGLPGAEEMCAQVITSGYEVVFEIGGQNYTYRTNSDGSQIREAY